MRGVSNAKAKRELHFQPRPLEWVVDAAWFMRVNTLKIKDKKYGPTIVVARSFMDCTGWRIRSSPFPPPSGFVCGVLW